MPTNIAFWNVQRLGQGTSQATQNAIITTLAPWQADRTILCELTTKSTFPTYQNLTYRKKSSSQLCYGAWDNNDTEVQLTAITPVTSQEYQDAVFKGGNDFKQLADRALAYVGVIGGAHVYAIHAPASNNAKKAMSFIACYLHNLHGDVSWVVLGDCNIDPNDLGAVKVGIPLGYYIFASGMPTHQSPGGTQTELDYAIANFPVTVTALPVANWINESDHSPILVSW